MSNIKVESGGINATISEFSSQIGEMNELLSTIKSKTEEVKGYWAGDDSDAVITAINNFMKTFDVVNERNKKYSDFLNKVITEYKAKDDEISDAAIN